MATAKYKRGKDGYFTARVWDGTYVGNKKHYVPVRSRKSSKDLELKVAEYKADVESRNRIRRSDISFLEYSRAWLSVFKAQRAHNTKQMYGNIIEKHFCVLSSCRLQDIDRIHLQTLLNHADGKARTQQQIYMTFKQVLQSAVSDRLFPSNIFDDIFSNIETVKYKPQEKRPLTSAEKSAVFSAEFSDSDRAFVYILYGCGLRRSEALALTIFDFNLKSRELTVNKAHEFVDGHPRQKVPKTSNGYRTVPIPDKTYPFLSAYVEKKRSCGNTYLFTMRDGNPLSKSSYDKMMGRIVRKMQDVSADQIVGLTAHVFRHNYCTQLCYQIPAISIKKIAQLMGDTEKMVLEVYNHIVLEKEDSAGAVNAAI